MPLTLGVKRWNLREFSIQNHPQLYGKASFDYMRPFLTNKILYRLKSIRARLSSSYPAPPTSHSMPNTKPCSTNFPCLVIFLNSLLPMLFSSPVLHFNLILIIRFPDILWNFLPPLCVWLLITSTWVQNTPRTKCGLCLLGYVVECLMTEVKSSTSWIASQFPLRS